MLGDFPAIPPIPSLPPVLDEQEKILLANIRKPEKLNEILLSLRGENSVIHALFEANYLRAANALAQNQYALDLNQSDPLGRPFVHLVCDQKDLNWFCWLTTRAIDGEVNLLSYSKAGQNIYHASAHNTDPVFLTFLFNVTKDKDHLFHMSEANENPLMMAIQFDNAHFFECYLRFFSTETLEFKDHQSQNILHLIARYNAVNCYRKLKQMIPKRELAELENMQNAKEEYPLTIANANSSQGVFQHMMNYCHENGMPTLIWSASVHLVTQHLENLSLQEGPSASSEKPSLAKTIELHILNKTAFNVDDVVNARTNSFLVKYGKELPADLHSANYDAMSEIVAVIEKETVTNTVVDQDGDLTGLSTKLHQNRKLRQSFA